jgi:hypothetical protein
MLTIRRVIIEGGDIIRCEFMSGNYGQKTNNYGQLMEFLLSERHRYDSDEEFRAYALGEVRRFISELRELEIELTMRPNFLEHSPSRLSAPKET